MITYTSDGVLRIPDNQYADHNIVSSFRERQIDLEKPVYVYRNLHTKGYSIKQSGKVVAHAKRLCVSNCKFIVSESGRQRVIKEKQKNVHAFIKGTYTTSGMGTTAEKNDLPVEITYNPYTDNSFVTKNFTPFLKLKGARFVILDENGCRGSYVEKI
jgi:hypothetical protein